MRSLLIRGGLKAKCAINCGAASCCERGRQFCKLAKLDTSTPPHGEGRVYGKKPEICSEHFEGEAKEWVAARSQNIAWTVIRFFDLREAIVKSEGGGCWSYQHQLWRVNHRLDANEIYKKTKSQNTAQLWKENAAKIRRVNHRLDANEIYKKTKSQNTAQLWTENTAKMWRVNHRMDANEIYKKTKSQNTAQLWTENVKS